MLLRPASAVLRMPFIKTAPIVPETGGRFKNLKSATLYYTLDWFYEVFA